MIFTCIFRCAPPLEVTLTIRLFVLNQNQLSRCPPYANVLQFLDLFYYSGQDIFYTLTFA